jgi:hypothetical protein
LARSNARALKTPRDTKTVVRFIEDARYYTPRPRQNLKKPIRFPRGFYNDLVEMAPGLEFHKDHEDRLRFLRIKLHELILSMSTVRNSCYSSIISIHYCDKNRGRQRKGGEFVYKYGAVEREFGRMLWATIGGDAHTLKPVYKENEKLEDMNTLMGEGEYGASGWLGKMPIANSEGLRWLSSARITRAPRSGQVQFTFTATSTAIEHGKQSIQLKNLID